MRTHGKSFFSLLQSVFRNYDHDHDGYISQEDFESIAANFPFLDSFCVLDKDQWVPFFFYFIFSGSSLKQIICAVGQANLHPASRQALPDGSDRIV